MGKLRTHAEIEVRRAMLAELVAKLRRAELLCAYKLVPQAQDMTLVGQVLPGQLKFLIEGLERALAGDADPFRLSARGRKPDYAANLLTAATAYALLRQRDGHSLEEARAEAAEAFGMSAETVRDALRDDLIRQRAAMQAQAALHYADGHVGKALERLRREAADKNSG